jgi:hypothetical protein
MMPLRGIESGGLAESSTRFAFYDRFISGSSDSA